MVFDDHLWRGRALSIATVMTALAIMLLAGGGVIEWRRRKLVIKPGHHCQQHWHGVLQLAGNGVAIRRELLHMRKIRWSGCQV